jgi:hypothetical protein
MKPDIKVSFHGDAQIEIGGPYAGVEFHHSSPMPQRISFFYPVANSIDLSTNYWKRDSTFVMSAGIREGYGSKEWIGLSPYSYDLTPYGVTFYKSDPGKEIKISYRFCEDKPAMIVAYEITNNSNDAQPFEFYTHLELSLRTSYTYSLKSKAWTEYDSSTKSIYSHFDDAETQNMEIFVANTGIDPESFNTVGTLKNYPFNGDWWFRNNSLLPELVSKKNNQRAPAAEYLYYRNLEPKETMTVIQIIGTSKQNECKNIVSYLEKNYKKEIDGYENRIIDKVNEGKFVTGDTSIDKSYNWAKGILAVNKHYLDNYIVPAPCPAEDNIFFTHDALVTDYAAVNFDLGRVKYDLNYVIAHANKDFLIPSLYYWKDSLYKTEFDSSGNCDNLWFIITAGSYLNHSADVALIRNLYPYLTRCLNMALFNKNNNNSMWADHIDGSCLQNNVRLSAFMTSLAVEALREYIFMSLLIGENEKLLAKFEDLAGNLEKTLNEKLWDDQSGYLINYYKDGKKDTHYFTNSLIASHFNLLSRERTGVLVNTVLYHLFDPKIGVYNIYPGDPQSLQDHLEIKDAETGSPSYYAGGGVWANSNAWFALALIADDKKDEAFNFIKKIMTLDGIINSSNGQPSMYEYRIGDYNNPNVYGKIDKPQYLQAAGWYIYCLYHLYGINENSWNISFAPFLPLNGKPISFTEYAYGMPLTVNVNGSGKYINVIKYDGKKIPSAVIPYNSKFEKVDITLGIPSTPYIASTNSLLEKCNYDTQRRTFNLSLKAFASHKNITEIISPIQPKTVYINGEKINENLNIKLEAGAYLLDIKSEHKFDEEEIRIDY